MAKVICSVCFFVVLKVKLNFKIFTDSNIFRMKSVYALSSSRLAARLEGHKEGIVQTETNQVRISLIENRQFRHRTEGRERGH